MKLALELIGSMLLWKLALTPFYIAFDWVLLTLLPYLDDTVCRWFVRLKKRFQ